MTEAVVCKGITKTYGVGEARITALRGIDLEVHVGELLMLVGPSGCGKTTLLSIISGILNQDSGDCYVFGKELNKMPQLEKTATRGKEIGFVFQSFNLIPMLSALENTSIPLVLNGVKREKALEQSKELLTRIGLQHRLEAIPAQMSGGEQQRVAIARGFIHRPNLIVCDEPTSALDHETGMKMLKIFREIVLTHETSLIIVTHDNRIFEFADRILQMDDGKITGVIQNHHHKN